MTNDELDLVETQELFDALMRRMDGCVMVTYRNESEHADLTQFYWKGSMILANGLLHEGLRSLNKIMRKCDDGRE